MIEPWHRIDLSVPVDLNGPVDRPTSVLTDEERAMPLFVIAREAKVVACGPADRFSDLGGDSLKALQAALAVEKVFGATIDPARLLGEVRLGIIVAEVVAESVGGRCSP